MKTTDFNCAIGSAGPLARLGGSLLAVVLLLTAPTLLPLSDAGQAAAQEEKQEENKNAPMSGRKTQALGKRVYDVITQANELVDVEDYNGARAILDKLDKTKLTPYETAQVNNFYGFLYYQAEQYKNAISAYKKVIAQPDIPEALMQGTLRTLAQLHFVTEDYNTAIKYAQQFIDFAGPDSDMYALIGTGYYQLEQTGKIIAPVEKAIALARERGTTVKEQWWLLLRVAYWEQDNYKKVKEILETLVVNWPKKEYWTQLSGIYYELKDEPRQLAAYEAAYDQGLLASNSELVQMAQLFMQADIPYKGAKVLDKALEAGQAERNVKNLRLLSQAWQMAREDKRAIGPLKEAASMSDDGELYARLANSYLNLSQYTECIDASKKALNKGKIKNTGNAWLVRGMCEFENKSLAAAKNSFRQSAQFDKTAKYANQWLNFVKTEEDRIAQINASLAKVRESS